MLDHTMRSENGVLNGTALRYAAYGLTGLSLAAAAWLLLQRLWWEAAIMVGFVVAAVLFGLSRDRLPSLFTFLFTLAAAINAAGYVWELWHSPFWFDEAVHVFTPFAIVSAIGWLMVFRGDAAPRAAPWRYVGKILLIGLAIGGLWEAFEWAIGIIGSVQDTAMDLVMDVIGAALAAALCFTAARSEIKPEAT